MHCNFTMKSWVMQVFIFIMTSTKFHTSKCYLCGNIKYIMESKPLRCPIYQKISKTHFFMQKYVKKIIGN